MELYPNHFTRNHCKSCHLRISLKKGRLPIIPCIELNKVWQIYCCRRVQWDHINGHNWCASYSIYMKNWQSILRFVLHVWRFYSVLTVGWLHRYIPYSVHDTINIYFWNSGLHSCFRSIFLIDSYTKCTNKEKSENFMTRKTIKKLEHFEIWWIFWCVLKLKSLSNF